MTTLAHVAVGTIAYAALGPELGLPVAVASHPILDIACRFHPPGLHWPWLSEWRHIDRAIWLTNVFCGGLLAYTAIVGWIDWRAVVYGGVCAGWLAFDVFHPVTWFWPNSWLGRHNPHRIIDALRDLLWPRPHNEPRNAIIEVVLTIVATFVAMLITNP